MGVLRTAGRTLSRLAGALMLASGLPAAAAQAPPPDPRRIVEVGVVDHGVPACRSCHGARGEGVAVQDGPRLAGLNADYLAGQLDAFATGARRNPVMEPIARALSDEQRGALSAYFAGLPPTPHAAAPAVPAQALTRGRALAVSGDWSRGVPACVACHGPGGAGVGGVTPPLVGQTQAYLVQQLTAYRDNGRKGALGLMNGIARRLSAAQRRDVAVYFASLGRPPAAPAMTR